MVKQAEKVKKRNPMLPVYGLILAVGLAVVAWLLANYLIEAVPQLRQSFGALAGQRRTIAQIAIAGGLWLGLLALAFFIVSLLVGKDPSDEAKKKIGLPPRQVKKRTRK